MIVFHDGERSKSLAQTDAVRQNAPVIAFQLIDNGKRRVALEIVKSLPDCGFFKSERFVRQRVRIANIRNELVENVVDRDVVNELKVFAADKDIPVITNSHLNRDASRTIEEASRKNNQDVGKLLGKSNIGESMLMIDNLDCGIIITLDFDKDQNRYMAFSLIKMRDKPQRTYIAQPFAQGSTIRLMEDYGGIPQFKETLHGAPELKSSVMKISGSSAISSALEDFDSQEYIKENNSFMSKSTYNLDDEDSIDEASDEFNNMLSSINIPVQQPVLRKVLCMNNNLVLDDSYDISKLNINWSNVGVFN